MKGAVTTCFAALAVNALATSAHAAPAPCRGVAAVFYGGNASDYDRLAAAPPEIVVPAEVETLDLAVPKLHPAGIKVLAYINTCYANTNCPSGPSPPNRTPAFVKARVDLAMQKGADGVFFDEASASVKPTTAEYTYYKTLFDYVKSKGTDKLVSINPGVGTIDESTLGVADVVCLECSWDSTQFNPPWKNNYDARRFWGLDGDCRTANSAAKGSADTTAARANHVGFHYATDLYVNLPSWYEAYIATPGVCAPAPAADAGADGGGGNGDGGARDAGASSDAGANDASLDAASIDGGLLGDAANGEAPSDATAGCSCKSAARHESREGVGAMTIACAVLLLTLRRRQVLR